MLPILALACYTASAICLGAAAVGGGTQAADGRRLAGLAIGVVAIAFHAIGIWREVFVPSELALNATDTASLVAFAIALIALVGALSRPRFAGASAVLLVLTGVLAAMTDRGARRFAADHGGWELAAHVMLATLAFAFMTVAAVLAIALALLEHRLRRRQPLGPLAALPPMDSLERSMFQAIGAGFALLSLALFSGFFFVDNLFAQHLIHKTVLACAAWVIFGILLAGRARFGWRGRTAVHWTLGGFALLGLAYFGSKLVLENVLGRHWG
ncbi:MAG TPA: cytochrome c biogenesis protein CcsA [Steroidobacteraceae bacterium]|nr:cytochrome c biogenesis protein CcsA [Steroidobacteraceae bacterium]